MREGVLGLRKDNTLRVKEFYAQLGDNKPY